MTSSILASRCAKKVWEMSVKMILSLKKGFLSNRISSVTVDVGETVSRRRTAYKILLYETHFTASSLDPSRNLMKVKIFQLHSCVLN